MQLPILAANGTALVPDNLLPLFLREAILQHAAAYLDCFDLADEAKPLVDRACADGARLIFIGTPTRATWIETSSHTRLISFQVPALNVHERKQLWQVRLGDALDGQADALAMRFPFTPGDIQRIAEAAQARALCASPTILNCPCRCMARSTRSSAASLERSRTAHRAALHVG